MLYIIDNFDEFRKDIKEVIITNSVSHTPGVDPGLLNRGSNFLRDGHFNQITVHSLSIRIDRQE